MFIHLRDEELFIFLIGLFMIRLITIGFMDRFLLCDYLKHHIASHAFPKPILFVRHMIVYLMDDFTVYAFR